MPFKCINFTRTSFSFEMMLFIKILSFCNMYISMFSNGELSKKRNTNVEIYLLHVQKYNKKINV